MLSVGSVGRPKPLYTTLYSLWNYLQVENFPISFLCANNWVSVVSQIFRTKKLFSQALDSTVLDQISHDSHIMKGCLEASDSLVHCVQIKYMYLE